MPKKRASFIAIIALAWAAAAQPDTLRLSLQTSAGLAVGGTVAAGRPLLPRLAVAGEAGLELEMGFWIPLALGVGTFAVHPSLPDSSLFLYRGFEGTYLKAETGLRLALPRATLGGLARQGLEFEALGGAAFAAVQDTGTTLVSADLFFILDPRLSLELVPGTALFLAFPLEYHPRGAARNLLLGARIGLSWAFLSGPVR